MNLNKFIGLLLVFISGAFICDLSLAADLSCDELKSSIDMVRSNSTDTLTGYRVAAGNSYRVDVIFAFKYFELNDKDMRAGRRLFKILPKNDKQYGIWLTMGDSLCNDESVADMKLLDEFSARFSLLLSRAVMSNPDEMPRYVEFSLMAAQDPHSDFALQMKRVCLAKHEAFKRAVKGLSIADRHWFAAHVMHVDHCKPLALPELN